MQRKLKYFNREDFKLKSILCSGYGEVDFSCRLSELIENGYKPVGPVLNLPHGILDHKFYFTVLTIKND